MENSAESAAEMKQAMSEIQEQVAVERFNLASYPTLLRTAKDPTRLRRQFDVLAEGAASGQIRNVVYNDARETVSRAVEVAWKAVRGPHTDGRWLKLPEEVRDLDSKISVWGIHNVTAAYKRLVGTKVVHPLIANMRALAIELAPLVTALADLKTKIVKGRAPSTGPSKPENPNKVVKTCPCCFRKIAVVRGKMAHHGYKRPGMGWQTGSCPGIRFKPLEVSNEGLVWLIGTYREDLVNCKAALARRDQLDVLMVRRGLGVAKVTPDMPEWKQELRFWCVRIESDIQGLTDSLPRLEKILAEWKPEKPE
ncbi:MAG: hypothetical protein WC617_12220 [Rhodanobacter sp.]